MIKKTIKQKVGDPIPKGLGWRDGKVFEYAKNGQLKGKVVAYFKINKPNSLRGGLRSQLSFFRVYESGFMVKVDLEMMKCGVVQGLFTPNIMLNSNKKEFDAAMKKFLIAIS